MPPSSVGCAVTPSQQSAICHGISAIQVRTAAGRLCKEGICCYTSAMDQRIVEFVAALRAAGVRVSMAESLDALRAVEQAGISERALLCAALRATLVKARRDQPIFERLFPLYFDGAGVALLPPEAPLPAVVDQALGAQLLAPGDGQGDQHRLAELFAAAVTGRPLGHAQLLALLAQPVPGAVAHPGMQRWIARQAVRTIGLERLEALLQDLLDRLRAAGMAADDLDALARRVRANQAILAGQLHAAVLTQLERQARPVRRSPRDPDTLLDLPFHALSTAEETELRAAVTRLAAQLRTRVSLRQRHDRRGALSLRRTLRASLRYGGTPFTLQRRRRRLQPRLVILCDVSSSMRTVAGLMLELAAALHDQVRHTRAFAYIDELHDVSDDFRRAPSAQASAAVLGRIAAAYVRTDLGSCLESFVQHELAGVDRRTTVLILGDGRNNGSDPGLAALRRIKAQAHRLIWLTPEPEWAWGSGDSAMPAYAPVCDVVRVVASLRQLSEAVAQALVA